MTSPRPTPPPATTAPTQGVAFVDGVIVVADAVAFVVVVPAPLREAPRVSVKPARGAPGSVDILAVEERARRDDGLREVAFVCEAERGPASFDVDIVVDRPGQPLVHLPGPVVPARDPP